MGFRYELVEEKSGASVLITDEFVLGRNQIPQGFTPSADFSRLHFSIRIRGSSVALEDLQSTNGTAVNGKKIAPRSPVVLKNNDQIRAGGLLYYFRALDSSNTSKAATAGKSSPGAKSSGLASAGTAIGYGSNPTPPPALPTAPSVPLRGQIRDASPPTRIFISLCTCAIVCFLAWRGYVLNHYSLPGSPNPSLAIYARLLAAVAPGVAVALGAYSFVIHKMRDGLARSAVGVIGILVAVLILPLSTIQLGNATNYYGFWIQNKLYYHCVSESTRALSSCKTAYFEAVRSNVKPSNPEHEKALEAFLLAGTPPPAAPTTAGAEIVHSDASVKGLPETAWYLGKIQEGVTKWVAFKEASSAPGFCRLDWACFLKAAKPIGIRSATELDLAAAVYVAYGVFQRKECGTDVGCKEKNTLSMLVALGELASSIKTSDLSAYGAYMKADYFRLVDDYAILRLIQKLSSEYQQFAAKHPESEDLATATPIFEKLDSLPTQIELLFTRLAPEKIDATLLAQEEMKTDPKNYEEMRKAFADYRAKPGNDKTLPEAPPSPSL